jgi:hypothetical protein
MRSVAVAVPVVALATMVFAARARLGEWRLSIVVAGVLWGLTCVGITEALSPFHLISPGALLTAWLAVLAMALVALRVRGGATVTFPRPSLDVWSCILVSAVGVLVLMVGVVAVVAPPNTHDSLTYHMARVAHWMQNRSVEPYPTAIQRQLYQSPGAEFAILHLQILRDSDRFANLVQWAAMGGSALASSLVVRYLGGNPPVQVFAAVIVATIPMGVLQASSAKNDFVVAFWLIAMLAAALAPVAQPSCRRHWLTAACGGALGLAILTKPTAYLFGAPLLGFVWLWWRRTSGMPRASLAMALVVVVACTVNTGHYARNTAIYGSPAGPRADGGYVYAAETFAPASIVSTVVRNVALHVGTPNDDLNVLLERVVRRGHAILGLDVDDPRVTWFGERFVIPRWGAEEDHAGNPLHVLLVIAAVVIVIVQGRRRPMLAAYASALVVGWLLFSAILKWQPWHSRLQLPFFVAASPLVAVRFGGRPTTRLALAAILLVAVAPTLLWNAHRPLVGPGSVWHHGRGEFYFVTADPDEIPAYRGAVEALERAGCDQIGVDMQRGNNVEYLFWILTRPVRGPRGRIEHIDATARRLVGGSTFTPCAIVAWNYPSDTYDHAGVRFGRTWISTAISVYTPCGEGHGEACRPVPR